MQFNGATNVTIRSASLPTREVVCQICSSARIPHVLGPQGIVAVFVGVLVSVFMCVSISPIIINKGFLFLMNSIQHLHSVGNKAFTLPKTNYVQKQCLLFTILRKVRKCLNENTIVLFHYRFDYAFDENANNELVYRSGHCIFNKF